MQYLEKERLPMPREWRARSARGAFVPLSYLTSAMTRPGKQTLLFPAKKDIPQSKVMRSGESFDTSVNLSYRVARTGRKLEKSSGNSARRNAICSGRKPVGDYSVLIRFFSVVPLFVFFLTSRKVSLDVS